jgi:hypothetical protein
VPTVNIPVGRLTAGDLYPVFRTFNLTGDDIINGFDVAYLFANWGQPGRSDLNGDGKTDEKDLNIILGNLGKTGPGYKN